MIIVTGILSLTVSKISQLIVQILNTLRFSAPFGGLGATYDDHLRLVGKRVGDFLLVLIELFSLGVTAEAIRANLFKIGDFAPTGGPLTQNFRQKESPHQPFFSQKTRPNDLSYGIKTWTDL